MISIIIPIITEEVQVEGENKSYRTGSFQLQDTLPQLQEVAQGISL